MYQSGRHEKLQLHLDDTPPKFTFTTETSGLAQA